MPEASDKQVDLVLITPERQVLEERVSAVVVPAHDGELGVLHDRGPLMCELGVGQLRYTQSGQTRRIFVDGGFAQVYDNHVTVLTSRAVPADQIDADMVRAAEETAGREYGPSDEDVEDRQRAQQRASTLRRLRPS